MSPPAKPWGKVIDSVLADGEWHDREEVIAAAMRAVPPGPAFRNGERRRVNAHPGERRRGDGSTAVVAGAREIARETLRARERYRTVERRGDQVRRRQ